MTKLEAARAVAALVGAFPNTRFTEDNAKAYEALLMDLDAGPVMVAVMQLGRTAKFLPTPSEIREAALVAISGPARSAEDAWGDVVQAIRRVGAYKPPPPFEDPLVAHAVERMGWVNLCRTSNETADRARFCELYGHCRDEQRKDRLAAPALAEGVSRALPAAVRELAAGIGGKP